MYWKLEVRIKTEENFLRKGYSMTSQMTVRESIHYQTDIFEQWGLSNNFVTLKDVQDCIATKYLSSETQAVPVLPSYLLFSKTSRQKLSSYPIEDVFCRAITSCESQIDDIFRDFQKNLLEQIHSKNSSGSASQPVINRLPLRWPSIEHILTWIKNYSEYGSMRNEKEIQLVAQLKLIPEEELRKRLDLIENEKATLVFVLRQTCVSLIAEYVFARVHVERAFQKEMAICQNEKLLRLLNPFEEAIEIEPTECPYYDLAASEVNGVYFEQFKNACHFDKKPYEENINIQTSCGFQRKINEDRTLFYALPEMNAALYAVFDGHSGTVDYTKRHNSSDAVDFFVAKYPEILTQELTRFENETQDVQVWNALVQTFLRLQEMWVEKAQEIWPISYEFDLHSEKVAHMAYACGTTACVVLRVGSAFYCANLGDSKAILVTKGGAFYELNNEMSLDVQSYQNQIFDRGGAIYQRKKDCLRLEGKLAMAGALGDILLPALLHRGEVSKIVIPEDSMKDTKIIIVSDGVTDVMTPLEIAEFQQYGLKNGKEFAEKLITATYHEGTSDNATALIVDFSEKLDG